MRPDFDWMQPPGPIRIGISACLLGEAVRFDGQHKRDAFIIGTLGTCFDFVPVCPEVAVGLGIPRQSMRLVAVDGGAPRAVGNRDATLDATEALQDYGRRMVGTCEGLSGYLFKSASPSCGMARVKVYSPRGGAPAKRGVGIFAAEVMAAWPNLPVEEEGRLGDPVLRENFIARVYAYHRWRALLAGGLTPGRMVAFHDRHKLTVMAHGAEPARALGRLVAEAGKRAPAELAAAYESAFMAHLRRTATRRTHTNVLHHLMGYLKRVLDAPDKQELLEVIESYRQGQVPLVVPTTLLRHHFRRHPHPYVAGQTYLEPHPRELMLRNGI